jgi:hypothetical protein
MGTGHNDWSPACARVADAGGRAATYFGINILVAVLRQTAQKAQRAHSLIFAMRHGFVTSYISFVMIFLMAANDGRTS